jgi:hypothetical protein
MNWEALGAIGEIVGAAGVIVTLGYLAVQIRQNTTVVSTSNFQELMRDYSNLGNTIADSAEAAEIFSKGLVSYEALSEVDKVRFQWMIGEPFRGAQTCFQLERRGLIDQELYADYMASFANLLRAPGVREYWASGRSWWHENFQEFVDRKLRERSA